MISYQHITKVYAPNTVALDDISFQVQEGEFVSVVGKSGAGKTTLLRLLIGEEKPSQGQVFFDNLSVHQIPMSRLPELRRNIGVVFQDYKLLESKTASENIAYVMELMGLEEHAIARDVGEVLETFAL